MSNYSYAKLGCPWIQLLILVVVACPYFVNLGASSLWDANESFYAETPREMLESGNYLAPQFNYAPRAQKPPLAYWIVLLSYKTFGVSEFAVRFPGALAALGVLLFTCAAGRLLFSPQAGILSALILALTARVFILARRLPIDTLLLFWLAGAAYFLLRALKRDDASRANWILFYLFLSLGFLTKGPVALLIPLASYLLWAVWARKLSFSRMHPATGALIFTAVNLPWYALIYRAHGWQYIAPFFLKDNLARFATESFGPSRGPFYYVGTFAIDFFPWSLFTVFLALYLWSTRKTWPYDRCLEYGFPLLWCAFVLIFFSLSKNKQEYYIVPMYPMMAVLIAGVAERTLLRTPDAESKRWELAWSWTLFAVSILLFGVAWFLLLVISALLPNLPALLRYMPCAILFLASGILAWQSMRGFLARGLAGLVVSISLLLLLAATIYIPAAERYRPVKEMCKAIEAQTRGDDDVGYFKTTVPSMVFYLRRPIFEEFDGESMVRRFQDRRPVFCILTEQDYNYFVGQKDLVLYVLERRPRLITQLRVLLDETLWPTQELLLVSNQPYREAPTREGQENP